MNSKKIVLDPECSFGKLIITETGITTDVIFQSWTAENENALTGGQLLIDVASVNAAVLFEQRIATKVPH